MNLERAKELLKIMIQDYQAGSCGGAALSNDDVINYLFTLDITEEELLELGFSEDAIDSANASIMSAECEDYKITIEETISQSFTIRAESMEVAEEQAIHRYKSGNLVVEDGKVTSVQLMTETTDGNESTSWRTVY